MTTQDVKRFISVLHPMLKDRTRCGACGAPLKPSEKQLVIAYCAAILEMPLAKVAQEADVELHSARTILHRMARRCGMGSREFRLEIRRAYREALERESDEQ